MVIKVSNDVANFEFTAYDENITLNENMAIFFTDQDLKSVFQKHGFKTGVITYKGIEYNFLNYKIGFTLQNDKLVYKVVFIFNLEYNIPGVTEGLFLTFKYNDGSEQFYQSDLSKIYINDTYPCDSDYNSCFRIINATLTGVEFKTLYDLIANDLASINVTFKGVNIREIANISYIGYKFILNQESYVDQIEFLYKK